MEQLFLTILNRAVTAGWLVLLVMVLLTIPALVFIYYFRTTEKVTFKGIVYATLIAGAILIFVNNIIIPYTVYVGAMLDLFFVNTLGLPVKVESNQRWA
jgi:hypothetical protein